MALGAENMQATSSDHFIVLFVSFFFVTVIDLCPLVGGDDKFFSRVIPNRNCSVFLRTFDLALCGAEGLGDSFFEGFLLGHDFWIAPKQDVGTTACHVGGDR